MRAALAVRDRARRENARRVAVAITLFVLAVAAPFVAAPLTGEPGATVGALLGSVVLAGCGIALWPWDPSAEERRHHELRAIWDEARVTDDGDVPWDRYVAWAEAAGPSVELLRVRWAGSSDAPSPLSATVIRRLDGEDVAEAAEAMEGLRGEVAQMEAAARDAHLEALSAAERRAHEEALLRVDETADAQQREAEAQMRRELEAQEAAEREAQAAAVARALRKP